MTAAEAAQLILQVTEGKRLCRATEKHLQDSLEQCLKAGNVLYMREQPLGPGDRPDFILIDLSSSGVVALEVKVKGSVESHLRQMKRYAAHEGVQGVLLVATRPYNVPETLNGKSVACLNIVGKCF